MEMKIFEKTTTVILSVIAGLVLLPIMLAATEKVVTSPIFWACAIIVGFVGQLSLIGYRAITSAKDMSQGMYNL